jgi:hypothetical protein
VISIAVIAKRGCHARRYHATAITGADFFARALFKELRFNMLHAT